MSGEKEINVNLFERLDLLDRLERVATKPTAYGSIIGITDKNQKVYSLI